MNTIHHFLAIIACLMLSLCYSHSAQAQADAKTSDDKIVAFAFYKGAGATPNFKRWVENTEPYISTPMARRKKVMERELSKLRREFNDFDIQQDLITVRTTVDARIWLPPSDSKEQTGMFIYDYVKSKGDEEKLFAFQYGEDHFAVVVEDLAKMQEMEFPLRQTEFFKHELYGSNGRLTAILQLRPKISDIEEPYNIDADAPHWLLVSEIASMTFWTPKGVLVHQYTAPWYYSPTNKVIEDLKEEHKKTKSLLSPSTLENADTHTAP
jgi:hypothetical protein